MVGGKDSGLAVNTGTHASEQASCDGVSSIHSVHLEQFQSNVAALRKTQPEVARQVTSIVLSDVVWTTGRDGSPTARLVADDGSLIWFGNSSMPRVSSEAMAGASTNQSGNVAIPGVLTGCEILAVSARRPNHVALFVFESDASLLAIAMHLYDYAPLMESGRLIWMTGEDPLVSLRMFLETHDGFELPWHVICAPQCPLPALDRLQRGLEACGAEHAVFVDRRQHEIGSRIVGPSDSGSINVAAVGIDPRTASVDRAKQVQEAAERLGWRMGVSVPSEPAEVHTLARLRAIERAQPHWVLYLGHCASGFRRLLPKELTVVSWHAMAGYAALEPYDARWSHDLWLAEDESARLALLDANYPSDQVAVLEPGVDWCDSLEDDASGGPGANSLQGGPLQAVVFMDVPDDQPDACHVVLASHVTFWEALRDVVSSNADTYSYERSEQYIALAEKKSGVEITESDIRTKFIHLLRSVVAPACVARHLVGTLVRNVPVVRIFGENWGTHSELAPYCAGPIPIGAVRWDTLAKSRLVIFGQVSGPAVEMMLQALASGATVMVRGTASEFQVRFPHLGELSVQLSQQIRFYRHAAELVKTARAVGVDQVDARMADRAHCRQRLAQHTIDCRLSMIHEWVGHVRAGRSGGLPHGQGAG